MKLWGAFLSFILFCIIGTYLGFNLSLLTSLENEQRKYLLAVELEQLLVRNKGDEAEELLRQILLSEKQVVEALAETNREEYEHYQHLIYRAESETLEQTLFRAE